MNNGKTFRHGQILRIVADARITNQEELRRRLAAQKLRVTQATLSRDLQELRLVKTHEGYKREAALPEETNGLRVVGARAGRIFVGHSSGGEHAGAEDASGSGAASRGGGRWRKIWGNRRDDRRRRYRADHHAGQEIAGNLAKTDRIAGPAVSRAVKNPQQVAVVGATGYSGFELARILLRHPKGRVCTRTAARTVSWYRVSSSACSHSVRST